jgi:hypothetical protein
VGAGLVEVCGVQSHGLPRGGTEDQPAHFCGDLAFLEFPCPGLIVGGCLSAPGLLKGQVWAGG